MKNIKYQGIFITMFILAIVFAPSSFAQKDTIKKSESRKISVKNLLDSQHFTFIAESVSPLRGGFRNLTSDFDVEVLKDTMQSYLPYFGRAYTSSYNSINGALDFTSTKISYSITPTKKGGWNVSIKPKDKSEIQEYLFTIYDNGSASLNVTSTSRDPISFNGYVTKN
jgi:hypothetical protein